MKYNESVKRILTTGVLSLLATGLFLVGTFSDSAYRHVYAKTQAEKELEETQDRIDELKEAQSDMKESLEQYEDDIEGVSAQIENIEDQIDSKQEEIDLIKGQIESLEVQKDDQYDTMKVRIRYTYENSGSGYLEALLTSESISELLNRVEYISSVREYDEAILDEYVSTCEWLKDRKSELKSEMEELEALRD
ncbi:MAG: DUF3450 family protein, partial [Eubacterium sp.]|nr:DUF3450 family protein [Eubacterium sp.]